MVCGGEERTMTGTARTALPPSPEALLGALRVVGLELGEPRAYWWRGTYHFPLDGHDGWTIGVTPESAGRVKVGVYRWSRPVDTVWARVVDTGRLAQVVDELAHEIVGVRAGA
jgi:hypothetical protein